MATYFDNATGNSTRFANLSISGNDVVGLTLYGNGLLREDVQYLNCFSSYDDIVWVSNTKKLVVVVFYIVLSIVNTIMNSLSIYVNVTTNHWKNQSMRMVLYISVIDILYGVIGYTAQIVHIVIPNQLGCLQRRFLLLFPHLCLTLSAYSVMFVALDRYFHVLLLSRYKDVITSARFNCLLLFYLLVGVVQTIITNFGPYFFGENGGAQYSSPVNLLFVSGTIFVYIISIIKLKIYTKSSQIVSAKTTNLNKLATAFLVILSITYSPIVVYTALIKVIKELIGAGDTAVLLHILLLLSNTNSSLNALAYLKLNLKARRRINTMFRKLATSVMHDESS